MNERISLVAGNRQVLPESTNPCADCMNGSVCRAWSAPLIRHPRGVTLFGLPAHRKDVGRSMLIRPSAGSLAKVAMGLFGVPLLALVGGVMLLQKFAMDDQPLLSAGVLIAIGIAVLVVLRGCAGVLLKALQPDLS